MSQGTITVFGGTGFLGRRVVRRALDRGWDVRVAARRRRPDLFAGESRRPVQLAADVRDTAAVADAVHGSAAVVNAVSLYVAGRSVSFEAIHVEAAGQVASAAAANGARLVHVSGIGVDPRSPSAYVRARALGESRLREADPPSVIARPSVIFGEGDAFLSALTGLVERLPVIPLFGAGNQRLQPVHVDDVARAVMAGLERGDTAGNTYELGGPQVLTYRELLQALAERLGKSRRFLPVPFPLWRLLAALLSPLPNPPLTGDQIELLRHDNIARGPSFEELGIDNGSLQSVLHGLRSG